MGGVGEGLGGEGAHRRPDETGVGGWRKRTLRARGGRGGVFGLVCLWWEVLSGRMGEKRWTHDGCDRLIFLI